MRLHQSPAAPAALISSGRSAQAWPHTLASPGKAAQRGVRFPDRSNLAVLTEGEGKDTRGSLGCTDPPVLDMCSWSTQLDSAWPHFHSQEGTTRKMGNAKHGTGLSTGGHSTGTCPAGPQGRRRAQPWSALSLSWHTEWESLCGKPLQVLS